MIHIYSVEPSTLQDLNTLTVVCRELATTHAQDDPLECGQQWGMIQNRNVKVFDTIPSWERLGADLGHRGGLEPVHHLRLPRPRHQQSRPSLSLRCRPNDLCRRKQRPLEPRASPTSLSQRVTRNRLSSLQERLLLRSVRKVISLARSQRPSRPSPSQQNRFVK